MSATSLAVFAQDDADEESAELDRVTVTGSRIKRSDVEGALPVTVIDREDIELTGESNAADLLRGLTFNSSGSYRSQSGNSFQGAALINLRGIGSSRSLVLVNGRRLPVGPQIGSAQDLTNIPMGAIERIEVLTDGASAVYGSDAIGGVVNVILRKDFTGAEAMIGAGSVDPEGGDREEGSAVFGASNSTSRIIAGVSWNDRDIIFARDFDWYNPGASVYGNSYTTLGNFDWASFPGGCSASEAFYLFGSPNAHDGSGQRCAYNFALVSADESSTKQKGIWFDAEHEFADEWRVYGVGRYSKTDSFGRYAPVPDSSYWYDAPIPVDSPNNPSNPASAMYNPAAFPDGTEPVHWWHRFDALGNRDNYVDNEVLDFVGGITGYFGDFEVDLGVRRTKSKTFDIGYNYLVVTTAVNYIADGTYDLQNPRDNPDNVLNAMKATISRIAQFEEDEAYASVAFDLFDLPAGPVQWFVGAETRSNVYVDQYDSLSEAGAIGGSAGNSAGGSREVDAFYFENLLPITDTFEMGLAARYDKYSDYGSDTSPKISGRWQALDSLMLRASYGEGFHAPSLDILTQKDSFSADSVSDPQSCIAQGQPADCTLQIQSTYVANPNLESENSQQVSFGVVWEPIDWFSIAFDYYDIEIENLITTFGSTTILAREQAGDPIPPGLGVTRDPATGNIIALTAGYGNEGTLETDGFDINAQFSMDLFSGLLASNLQVSYINNYSFDGGRNRVDDPGLPQARANLWTNYQIGDFQFAWNVNYIADQCDDFTAADGCVGHVPSWVTNDFQANWYTPWNGRVTVGVQNAANKTPPIGVGAFGSRDYDFNLYNGFGRIVYWRYKQTF
jgi:iron complex outermembrane receptor protein